MSGRSLCLLLLLGLLPAIALAQALPAGNETEGEAGETAGETLSLLPLGAFDQAAPGEPARPAGWNLESGEGDWAWDQETKLAGPGALRVTVTTGPVVIACSPFGAGEGLAGVSGVVMGKSDGPARAAVRWIGPAGVLREDALKAAPPLANGWRRFSLSETNPPEGAAQGQLVLVAEGAGTFWWDSAQLFGMVTRKPSVALFYNQVGYDQRAPKHFTVQSNFQPASATFEITTPAGDTVAAAQLKPGTRIVGANGEDWGAFYFRGDFSAVEITGTFIIRVTLDGSRAESAPFRIDRDLLWNELVPLALKFVKAQQSGAQVPGIHEAFHQDDAVDPETGAAVDLAGGWADDGRLGKLENVPTLWALCQAYAVAKWRFTGAAGGDPALAREMENAIRVGAEYVKKLLAAPDRPYAGVVANEAYLGAPGGDTDGAPGTGDERKAVLAADTSIHIAALASAARCLNDPALIQAGGAALDAALAKGNRSPAIFSAAMDLYLATRDEKYGKLAQELFPGVNLDYTESVFNHDDEFETFTTVETAIAFLAKADEIVRLAQNPFGVCTYGPAGKPVFFAGTADAPTDLGNTAYILRQAEYVARACRFSPKPEYLGFIQDQLNWLLGNNPFGISMIEGAGRSFPPALHSLYRLAGIRRGAMPGAIANGIGPVGPGDDRPFFDLRDVEMPEARTNGCTTQNCARLISTLAHLKRFRINIPQQAPGVSN